jgi:CheY-like chemotaxis protein
MEKNISVVIVEDTRKDVQRASHVLQQAGVNNPAVFTFVPAALMFLEDVVSGARSCPDLMILDLDFGSESGFEVLRFYKAHPELKQCHVIVWTVMGNREQELCQLFGVTHFLSKHKTDANLLSLIKDVRDSSSNAVANQ